MINNTQKTSPKWQVCNIGDIFDVTNGKTNTDDAVVGGQYPLFDRSVTIKQSDKYLFDADAVIIPGEGKEFIPKYYNGKFDLHQRAYAIFPKKDTSVDTKYLYYWINYKKDYLIQKAVGSTVKSLRLYMLTDFPLLLPSLDTQQKIATILSIIDQAIQKTDQIIEKTEKLKNGLMTELLTKGIGHTKFKKTKIGEIPEEWSIELLSSTDIKIIDGDRGINYPKKDEFQNSGYCLFLSTKNIINDTFNFRESIFITKEKDSLLRKGKLQKYDVILTTRGTVGNVGFFNDSVPYQNIRINSGMLIFRAGNSFDPQFLYFLMKSPLMKKTYSDLGSGSAQPQLPISSLKNLQIAVPTIKEQQQIASKLQLLDDKYNNEKDYKKYLLNLKNGLMSDIFSQKVEVGI